MKTRLFDSRLFTRYCVCAAGLLGLFAHAESGGAPQSGKLTLGALCERIDRGLKMAETNSDEKVYKNGIFSGAVRDVNAIGKLGDRAALPFLEGKSLSTNLPSDVRARATEVYVSLATAEECAAFLPKIFAVGNEEKSAGGWRNKVTPAGLAKIDAAIAKHELPDEIMARFQAALLMFAQSTDNSWGAKNADDFLSKHCEGYSTSKQRVALWHTIVTTGNEWSKEKYAPLSESLEAIPPRKRVDLRSRFPDLPPLPEDKADRKPLKVALAVGTGLAALVAACVAILVAWKRRKARNHADGQPNPR